MHYIFGVDGGGTKTHAVIIDETGHFLGQGVTGPSNFHSVGSLNAVNNIVDSMTEAARQAGLELTNECFLEAHIGLAGVGRKNDHEQMFTLLKNRLSRQVRGLTLTTDAHIALVGATAGEDGVVVIAGTGSIALGIKDGHLERAGGWGYLLDDKGSGYDLGRQAITAALRSFDGRGPKSLLEDLICRHFKLDLITDIIAPVYAGTFDRAKIGELAHLVVVGAEFGDIAAKQILIDGGHELACTVNAVAKRLGLQGQFPITYTGGVLSRKISYLYPTFVADLVQNYPEAEIKVAELEPVYGALIMAAQKQSLEIQPMIRRWKNHEAKSNQK